MYVSMFCKQVQVLKDLKIITIRIDHDGQFENKPFLKICTKYGISHDFLCTRTPQ